MRHELFAKNYPEMKRNNLDTCMKESSNKQLLEYCKHSIPNLHKVGIFFFYLSLRIMLG